MAKLGKSNHCYDGNEYGEVRRTCTAGNCLLWYNFYVPRRIPQTPSSPGPIWSTWNHLMIPSFPNLAKICSSNWRNLSTVRATTFCVSSHRTSSPQRVGVSSLFTYLQLHKWENIYKQILNSISKNFLVDYFPFKFVFIVPLTFACTASSQSSLFLPHILSHTPILIAN